ncbi:MAG: hypothetical protein NC293_09290 [Roseburia sp.]|nr:hypothetical protein [Roseburia sp.]
MENFLDQLLGSNCPSIEYRTRKEILNEPLSDNEVNECQKKIWSSPKVHQILEWQNRDGYFGTRLHTAPTGSKIWPHEGCVRCLLEMGVQLDFKPLQKALDIMLVSGWEKEGTDSKAAQAIGFGIIRASLFAQAGLIKYDFVHEWVEAALQAFRYVAEADSYSDIAIENRKGKFVFLGNKRIPTVFHMRMLAYTDMWRIEENQKMLAIAIKKLYEWLPLPPTYIKAGSQLVAPLGNIIYPINGGYNEKYGFWWFHFHELAARMGMLNEESPFRKKFDLVDGTQLERIAGNLARASQRTAYINWGAYSGLALNDDWKSIQNRILDLTFRLCLAKHYGMII